MILDPYSNRGITKRCTGAELRRAFAALINAFSGPGYRKRYVPKAVFL